MIELIEQPNGNLLIKVVDKQEFSELMQGSFANDERYMLCEMLEAARYLGNDWHVPFELGLTEVPAIGYGASYINDESIEPDNYEKLWIFSDYMVVSFLDELLEKGEVIFNRLID